MVSFLTFDGLCELEWCFSCEILLVVSAGDSQQCFLYVPAICGCEILRKKHAVIQPYALQKDSKTLAMISILHWWFGEVAVLHFTSFLDGFHFTLSRCDRWYMPFVGFSLVHCFCLLDAEHHSQTGSFILYISYFTTCDNHLWSAFRWTFRYAITQRGAVTMKILTVPWYRTYSNGSKKRCAWQVWYFRDLCRCPRNLGDELGLLWRRRGFLRGRRGTFGNASSICVAGVVLSRPF